MENGVNMILTPMFDAATNRSVNVVATEEDTLKMQRDLVFATQKFEEAWAAKLSENALMVDGSSKSTISDDGPSGSHISDGGFSGSHICDDEPSGSHISDDGPLESYISDDSLLEVNISDDDENLLSEVFKWPHSAILLLIEEYQKKDKDISAGKISQKKAWGQISQLIVSHGYSVTASQCMSKWAGLKKTYKSTKDHNGKSGNSKKNWAYFDAMDSFLGCKPFMEPVVTISSTGTVTTSSKTKRRRSCSEDDDLLLPSPSRLRRSTNTGRREQAEQREQGRERRHAESMQRKDKALNLLKRLTEYLEKSDKNK